MIAGPEFGSEDGKSFLVVKALYGLKSASFSFQSFMAENLPRWDSNHRWQIWTCG